MALYSRTGRPRPQSGGFELFVWYYMRLSGVALFVLALVHFSVMHFVFDPSQENAQWIFDTRWNSVLLRTFDWLLLMMVVTHSFLGIRTVTMDYLKGGWRTLALTTLYLVGIIIFVMGTSVVLAVQMPGGA
jgi:succinate dehydrogenase / fumarate reductase membrane anchor subunit